jgi:WXXGXW repeat (2 copies)
LLQAFDGVRRGSYPSREFRKRSAGLGQRLSAGGPDMRNWIRGIAAALLLATLPFTANAAVFVSVNIAPPALPVYTAPPMPAPGYFWTPGYWAWAGGGYYWVPGTWVLAPAPGLLWTPGYWGWAGGAYAWHPGYWGPHVGFYGGINYGFGYGGVGFHGGAWEGGRFVANTTVINNTTIVNETTVNRVSYNGGTGGVVAKPTAAEERAAQEHHVAMSETQQQHELAASRDTTMRASYNHGRPSVAATQKAGVFYGKGVVAARSAAPSGAAPHGATPTSAHGTTAQHAMSSSHTGGEYGGHGSQPGAPHGGYPAPAQGAPHGNPSYHSQGHGGGEHPQQSHGGEHGRPG